METSLKSFAQIYLAAQNNLRCPKVGGLHPPPPPSPARKPMLGLTAAGLAQSVERLTAEWEVAGSIPGAGPILRVLK